VTKDGVTVSKAINLKDPIKRMGAELIREAASRTNDVAGDGTTTATVLTNALVAGGIKLAAAGYPTNKLTSGIELSVERIIKHLKQQAKNITITSEVSQIGTISANGDKKIGDLIADAMDKVGRDGIITVEDAKGMATTLDLVEGMQFERGYLSPYFVTNNEKMCAAYPDAAILVTDKKITSLKELIPILEEVQRTRQSLLIIADEVEAEALQGLVLNRVKANLPVVAIKAPGYGPHRGQYLNDICVLTGASLVSSNTGLTFDKVKSHHLGKSKRIVVDAKTTTIVGTGMTADVVAAHVNELRSQLRDITLNVDDTSILKARIARLASGVAVIKVGGSTEIEMVERKYRIEDALHATRAAVEEGIVAGGGSALIRAANSVDFSDVTDPQVLAGVNVVKEACYAPLRQIVSNASGSPDVIISKLEGYFGQENIGYNAADNKFCDMLEAGVIDPVKVTRCALQHASSVATTFLALDAVIYEDA
jgi:chaperonin GroEL